MTIPLSTTYEIGATIYGAPITLAWTRGSAGEKQWVLVKDAADQRDDTQRIAGITDEQIKAMWDALLDQKQYRR